MTPTHIDTAALRDRKGARGAVIVTILAIAAPVILTLVTSH